MFSLYRRSFVPIVRWLSTGGRLRTVVVQVLSLVNPLTKQWDICRLRCLPLLDTTDQSALSTEHRAVDGRWCCREWLSVVMKKDAVETGQQAFRCRDPFRRTCGAGRRLYLSRRPE
jgi:hypothetical protein